MAGMFGSSSNAKSTPDYTGMQLQTSAEGMCIPICWGKARISPNLIWTDNFHSHKGGGGKKGGGKGGGGGGGKKGGGSTTSYSAAIKLAICEGPIQGIGTVYKDNSTTTLAALGLTLYPGSSSQAPWSDAGSGGAQPMSYRLTAYVVSNNYELGPSATLSQHGFEVTGLRSGSIPGEVDIDPTEAIYDLVTSDQYGLGMPPETLGDRTQLSDYCVAARILLSPVLNQQEQATSIFQRWAQITNSWIFWSGGQLKFVPLGDYEVSARGRTYVPDLTPKYSLTFEDFQGSSNEPLIRVNRADPADGSNWIKVEITDRNKQYNPATIEYKDPVSIEQNGLLQAQDVQAAEICNRDIGNVVASILGQRSVYVRNKYTFKLLPNFVLLEPGDIVTLTEPNIGLAEFPVRIFSIAEDERGLLDFQAEECPQSIGTPATYTSQGWEGILPPPSDSDPGDVNEPTIVEPQANVTQGVAQLWIGLSGGDLWGGAQVWISVDNTTYVQFGTIVGASPQGTLITALPSHADPDTVDTLSVDLSNSQQILSSAVTHADADANRAVAIVDDEVIAYGGVVPNGLNSYSFDLTYLRRGAQNTSVGAHAIGAPFCAIIPDRMLKLDLPKQYVGQTLYLKFPSFNIYGGALQDISDVVYYTYIPYGPTYSIAPPTSPTLAVTTPSGSLVITMTAGWTASIGPDLGSYEVQFSEDSGSTWLGPDVTIGGTALSFTLSAAKEHTNYRVRVRALNARGTATSAWATSGIVNSGANPSTTIIAGIMLPMTNGDLPVGLMTDEYGALVFVVT